MACPSSGQIKISDLVAEFGGSAPHAISEYYRNGANVPGNNTNVATSGQISLTQFYAAVNEIQHVHSSNATHQNYATVFGDNWASTVPKRIVINSGITIGGTSTHAMLLPSGMGGTLVIDNNGNIEGYNGASNGGAGGNAIHCIQTSGVTINNASGANIKAGGGGGGQGGTGGTGGNGGAGGTGGNGAYESYLGVTGASSGSGYVGGSCGSLSACISAFGNPINRSTSHSTYWQGTDLYGRCNCYRNITSSGGAGGAGGTSGGAGGAGGAGGVGQGYTVSATSGAAGSSGAAGGSGASGSAGGTSAGTGGTGGGKAAGGGGGTGGTGGAFGASGAAGNNGYGGGTGYAGAAGSNGNSTNGASGASGVAGAAGASGSSGGAAGYYIYNRASITLNNSGTVAGQ